MLSRDELAGVIAHELAHYQEPRYADNDNRRRHLDACAVWLVFGGRHRDNNSGVGALGSIALIILAPLAAMIVQMAISSTREYAADEMGAQISGEPMSLASALAKIADAAEVIPNETAEQAPATAHLFIVNPLSGARMDNLFSTHPAIENRIAALRQLAGQMGTSGHFRMHRHFMPQAGPWSRY